MNYKIEIKYKVYTNENGLLIQRDGDSDYTYYDTVEDALETIHGEDYLIIPVTVKVWYWDED